MEKKQAIVSYIQNISLFLLGMFLMFFPLVFTTISTNPIILPKMILLAVVFFALVLLYAASIIIEKSVRISKTPFDIPVVLFIFFVFLSAIFSVNRADALMAFVPFFFGGLIYFLIVNIAKDKNSLLFLMSTLIIAAVLLSIFSLLTFFKIYSPPAPLTQNFSPLGSMLDQSIYLFLVFAVASYCTWRSSRRSQSHEDQGLYIQDFSSNTSSSTKKHATKTIVFGLSSLIILMGAIVSIYSLLVLEKPLILPLETGFQTAFAEISLDAGRIAKGFLLGSGFGTYFVDFSRWKQAAFNQNQALWNLTFFRSSSFALELLATTGVLGFSAFIFIFVKVLKEVKRGIQNNMLFSLLAFFILAMLLPLGFVNQTFLFIILGLFAVNQGLKKQEINRFFDIELEIVALKKGLIAIIPEKSEKSLILPCILTLIIIIMVGTLGYFSFNYVTADLIFQKSLVSAAQNNGALTYQQQRQAISKFPYRDGFYRVFSQTNLALANALASQQPKDKAPNTLTQQQITALIQQSINSARIATTLAPQTYLNWQNLSSIYRSLIGFGQNAEDFAIRTARQSIALDPNNPQQYITLGGIYYQIQQWDNAQNQFQIAVALKPDFANSHYNLGHALEQKGDLEKALVQYQLVKGLVANDKKSLDQITSEINLLQDKIATNRTAENTTSNTTVSNKQPLNIDTAPAKLPPQTPPVKIPAPDVATRSSR